jgi:hypothetical protein
LPIIGDGKLNHILRKKLEELDLTPPETPYELGLKAWRLIAFPTGIT